MAKQEFSIPALMAKVPTEADAYLLLEELRWGDGDAVCPHCGVIGGHYFLTPKDGVSRKTRTGSRSQRRVWKCSACRKQFSVLTGTIFHGSKIPVRTWLMVVFELCASKNGVSAREIERKYDLTPKTAWFMLHRIREAMKREPLAGLLSGVVQADETFIGGKPSNMPKAKRPRWGHLAVENKTAVVSLIHEESGEVRSQVVPNVTGNTLREVIRDNTDMRRTKLHTDGFQGYAGIGQHMESHHTVNHAEHEYVRAGVTTNAVEGYFSQLKRSIDGTHHHVSREHLDRYLGEFDFRASTHHVTDSARMRTLVDRTGGRRLTYRPLTGSEGN